MKFKDKMPERDGYYWVVDKRLCGLPASVVAFERRADFGGGLVFETGTEEGREAAQFMFGEQIEVPEVETGKAELVMLDFDDTSEEYVLERFGVEVRIRKVDP